MHKLLTVVATSHSVGPAPALDGSDLTLRRVPGSWVFGPKAGWSNGTTSPIFVPLSESVEPA